LIPYFTVFLGEKALLKHGKNYGFAPEQTHEWWITRFISMDRAKRWRAERFGAAEARPWMLMNIGPGEASEWRAAGVQNCPKRQSGEDTHLHHR